MCEVTKEKFRLGAMANSASWRDYLVQRWARRVYTYDYRQHSWMDHSCYGGHGRYAEFNGMDCCFDLSLRSGGICLVRNGTITSAINFRRVSFLENTDWIFDKLAGSKGSFVLTEPLVRILEPAFCFAVIWSKTVE
jgi:hypothetical protein